MSDSQPISQLLASNNEHLQNLIQRASLLHDLSQKLQNFLSPPLADHVRLANIRDKTVVLVVDDTAWLTNIRYRAPMILNFVKQDLGLSLITQIQFKVTPSNEPPVRCVSRRPKMSPQTANLLLSASESTPDPALKSVLKQLARNIR